VIAVIFYRVVAREVKFLRCDPVRDFLLGLAQKLPFALNDETLSMRAPMNRLHRFAFFTLLLMGSAGSVKADYMQSDNLEPPARPAAARLSLSSLCEAMFRILPLPEWLTRAPVEPALRPGSTLDLSLPVEPWTLVEPVVVPTFLPPLFGEPEPSQLRFGGRLITGEAFEDLEDIEGAEVSISIVH
jgi:hypothetical protein